MRTRYYFYLDEIRWVYDAPKEETEESMRLKSVIAIARYVMEHPDKIRIQEDKK